MPPKGATKAALAAAPPPENESAAAAQQRANTPGIADFELPRTSLTKLAKGSIPDNVKMQQDVVLALMRSSTLFISYLTAAAHDQAIARSGKSITASDVIKAIIDLDFGPADNLVPILEHELAVYRNNLQAAKASKAKPPGPGRGRRRKSDATGDVDMTGENGDEGDDDEGGEDEIGDDDDGGDGEQSEVMEGDGDDDDQEVG